MNLLLRQIALTLALSGLTTIAFAADDPVLINSSKVTIKQSDYEAELTRLPEDLRGSFATSKPRISKLLNSMLVNRTLAEDARRAGLDKDPLTQKLLALQLDKFLAELSVEHMVRDWNAQFDAQATQHLRRAQEWYAADKERFRVPEQVSVSHILIKTDSRSKEEALKLAQSIRAKAIAPGADFAKLADEFSDDKSVKVNHGDLSFFPAKQMDPAFSEAAFAMKKKGEISEPVLSQFGYHIIRFQDRKPSHIASFDEAKDVILTEMRQKFLQEKRTDKFNAITTDSSIKLNEPAIDALKVKVTPPSAAKQDLKSSSAR